MPGQSVINALTAPDAYTPASTLDLFTWVRWFNIDVSNQAIYWQLKQAQPGARNLDDARSTTWTLVEVYMPPGSRSIIRALTAGLKFRAAIPAAQLPAGSKQAVVTVEAVLL